MKLRYLAQLALVIFFGCRSSEIVDKSEDLIFVSAFTKGLEGPAVDKLGNLFFVNPIKNGTIGIVSSSADTFKLLFDSLPNGSIANGIRFNSNGDMFMADYINHNIWQVESQTGELTIFAYDSTMNQPNDLAIAANGVLYASDPNWSEQTGQIWRVDVQGNVTLLEKNMGTTNGIEVAPGDSILYVNESIQRKVWRYQLAPDGNISNKQLLITFPDFGLDGMRCDVQGNLYIARYDKGTIVVVSPAGEVLREVTLTAQKPTNIAFGGPDGKTCYVTCQDRGYIEYFQAEYVGRSWTLQNK